MKKIVSFSLWGNNPKYTIGAIENAKLIPTIYGNEWIARYYIANDVPVETITMLKSFPNVEIVRMNMQGNWNGLFWRFIPLSEKTVSIVLSRDTDSRVNIREKEAVTEWLKSGKSFHIMRDHPFHNTHILGGMWGSKSGVISDVVKLMSPYLKGNFKQVDQIFLRDKVYPLVVGDSFIHDSFFSVESFSKPFPTPRISDEFVGQVYDEHNQPNLEFANAINSMKSKVRNNL